MIFSQNLVQDQTGRLEQDLDDLYSGFDLPKFHEYKKLLPIKLEEEKHTNHMDLVKNFYRGLKKTMKSGNGKLFGLKRYLQRYLTKNQSKK